MIDSINEDSGKEEISGLPGPVQDNSPRRSGWFARFLLCVAVFLAVTGLVFLEFYFLGMEPFGTKAVTIDDAKIQYIDFLTYFVDVLHGVRPLSYDFANLLGGSSLGLFSYYLSSPFNLLLYFFGKEGVYRFFNIAVALKLGTAGAAFSWYLQRRFADRIRLVFVVVLAMGYGLMQYSIAQCSNIMWLDGVYMLPLILLGVYEVIHRRSVWRLSLTVAFCILCNWYIAGICCLFSGIWFVFEFFFCDPKEKGERKGVPEGKLVSGQLWRERTSGFIVGMTDFFVSFIRYVWGMGLGVALSAVLFLPAISALRQGKGQYEETKVLMKMSGDLLSFVRGYVIGTGSSRGFVALFCGGIAVFAAAALLFSGGYRITQKAAFLALTGICFLMLHWEPAMLAFSLLKRVDSYWYRYSFLVSFVLLFGAGAYLSRAERDRWSKLFVMAASLLFSAAVLKLNGIHFVDFRAQGIALVQAYPAVFATAAASVILALLTVILTSVKPEGLGHIVRFAAGMLLLAVTGAELWSNAYILWKGRTDDSQTLYMEYSKGMQEQLSRIRELDDGYYRIAQDRTRWHYEDDLTAYFNDSLAQNYWSNAAYTSTPDNLQLSLMWRLGYRDEAGRMMVVRDPILASDSFLGVKYLLQSTPVEGLKRVKEVEPFNGRAVYRNPYALPMAFVYDGKKLPTRRYENTYVYQNALFSVLSGRKTELYRPLEWTRYNEGGMSYFRVYVPEGKFLIYGNLLWPEKMGGFLSINGAEPFGYCRWKSPASFLIRSRIEQSQSETADSLQAKKKLSELAAAESGPGTGIETGQKTEGSAEADLNKAKKEISKEEQETDDTASVSETELEKAELKSAAAAFDARVLADVTGSGYADIRTVVFRTEKGLTFNDYQFYGLDLAALREASRRIRSGEITDVTFENGKIHANLLGRHGQSLCLLVPWSKGWQVLRNGEPVQPDTVAGSMITISLVDGTNNIEMTYHIPYLREGMYISAAAFGILLLDALHRLVTRRKRH